MIPLYFFEDAKAKNIGINLSVSLSLQNRLIICLHDYGTLKVPSQLFHRFSVFSFDYNKFLKDKEINLYKNLNFLFIKKMIRKL